MPTAVETKSGSNRETKKSIVPLLLHFKETIGGQVRVNPQCSDDSTYMGSTQSPDGNGVADYQSD
jgi:hypothetical protein